MTFSDDTVRIGVLWEQVVGCDASSSNCTSNTYITSGGEAVEALHSCFFTVQPVTKMLLVCNELE